MDNSERYKLELARLEHQAEQCRQRKKLQVMIMACVSVVVLLVAGTVLHALQQREAADQLFATVSYILVGGGGYSAGWFSRRHPVNSDQEE